MSEWDCPGVAINGQEGYVGIKEFSYTILMPTISCLCICGMVDHNRVIINHIHFVLTQDISASLYHDHVPAMEFCKYGPPMFIPS